MTIYIVGIPKQEREEKEKKHHLKSDKRNCSELDEYMNMQTQETQQTPISIKLTHTETH